jgi:hypothetical protein
VIFWNQQFSAKSEINPYSAIFCGQNIGNEELSSPTRVCRFFGQSRKIFKTLELLDIGTRQSPQNIDLI